MKKTAIITGGSRGIGFATALQLGRDGFQIVTAATRPEADCQDKFKIFADENIPFLYVQTNIRLQEEREALLEKAAERFGDIHVLVNNAGVAPTERADLLEMSEESFDTVMDTNTKATMFMTQITAKKMIGQPRIEGIRGIIINVSSCSAVVSSISRGEYCISKAGVSMLTTLYADRLAGEGILVNEVRPGVIETDMTSAVREKYDRKFAAGEFPIPRWGRPEDVAAVVSALCSGKFPYTTGNFIDVDGGFHIKRL